MEITLENISKRYIHEWVFKNISIKIKAESKWAIVGPNGSGKSTLLQIISGFRLPSSGNITYRLNNKTIEAEAAYQHISFASPYIELIEEFTLMELVNFHFQWRKKYIPVKDIIELFNLKKAVDKPIKYFSSGMKQRLKLAVAFGTASDILLLDEPTANLDSEGIQVYNNCIHDLVGNRTLVIASNEPMEYELCNNFIGINNYK